MTQDIRWRQRFNNYQSALAQLQKFIDKGELTDLEQQGLIKAFEYTFELAWKTLKNYLEYQGEQDIFGSRDCIRKAFQAGIIRDGQVWMDMLASRNKTSHTYNQETADEITRAIVTIYHPVFVSFRDRMLELAEKQEEGC